MSAPPGEREIEARVGSVLEAARQHAASIPLDRLAELLPEGAPATPAELADWLRRRPGLAEVGADGRVRAAGAPVSPDSEERRRRAEEFRSAASWLLEQRLGDAQRFLRCALVTGSVAYGEPEASDDCDLMLVTRPGTLWSVLLWSFLRLRGVGRSHNGAPLPTFCLNYVVEEDVARREFSTARGFLFAREALSAQPVFGQPYYASLLGEARWLRAEVPRMFDRWESAPPPPETVPGPGLAMRLLNAAAFPWVAAYLQCKGLYACYRLRRAGDGAEEFHTVTQPKRMALQTLKFERLRAAYAAAPAPS